MVEEALHGIRVGRDRQLSTTATDDEAYASDERLIGGGETNDHQTTVDGSS